MSYGDKPVKQLGTPCREERRQGPGRWQFGITVAGVAEGGRGREPAGTRRYVFRSTVLFYEAA